MAMKNSVVMAIHSFPVPHPLDFNMLVILSVEMLNKATKLS